MVCAVWSGAVVTLSRLSRCPADVRGRGNGQACRCGVARALFLSLFFFFRADFFRDSTIPFSHGNNSCSPRLRAGRLGGIVSGGIAFKVVCAERLLFRSYRDSNGEQTCSRSRRWCIVPPARYPRSPFLFVCLSLTTYVRRCRSLISQPLFEYQNCLRNFRRNAASV